MSSFKTEIVDLTTICMSFPEIAVATDNVQAQDIIYRENLLNSIDGMFMEGVTVVGVQGPEGIGKTVTLAQYAKSKPDNALSIFIRPNNRWGYDVDLMRFDLCNQIEWLINGKELPEDFNIVNDGFLRQKIRNLVVNMRFNRENIYFIVDGISDIPKEDIYVKDLILDLLPFGYSNFKFLISGELPEEYRKGESYKEFRIPPFTFDETKKLFFNYDIKEDLLEEIHRSFKGVPSHLASVKRILKSGKDVNALDLTKDLAELFEVEWLDVENNAVLSKLLAILTYERNKIFTLNELSEIVGINIERIRTLISNLSFLSLDNRTQQISFVSESFRKFAAKKLGSLKEVAHKMIISYLLKEPKSVNALNNLPNYFKKMGRNEELIAFLSPENMYEMLQRNQSLSIVQEKAELGVNTAREMCKDGDLMRFALYKSTMKDLDGVEVSRSEIEAKILVEDFESAINLAQTAVLKEDRLHLFAIIAKEQKKRGLYPDHGLMEQIYRLYEEIDHKTLGERAIDIASDLIFSSPELAVKLAESVTETDKEEHSLDWALAKLSIAAFEAKGERVEPLAAIDRINSKIKNPIARNLSKGISLVFGDYSANEMIQELDKLDSVTDKIFVIRQWLLVNKSRDDAYKLSEYSVNLIIKTTEYAPTALVFRELATPIPYMKNAIQIKKLIGIFESQDTLAEYSGPTEDYVKLQLILAEGHNKYNRNVSCNRLVEVYLYIVEEIEDLSVKAACLANFICSLEKIDPKKEFEDSDGLHSMSIQELDDCISRLINTTAEHYYVTRNIVVPLAKEKPRKALNIAKRLNIETRRNMILLEVTKSNLDQPFDKIDFSLLQSILGEITHNPVKDEALINIIDRIIEKKEIKKVKTNFYKISPFLEKISEIQDIGERCRLYCLAYSLLTEINEKSELAADLLKKLRRSWEVIDSGWRKVNYGFKISSALAETSLNNAQNYIKLAENIRDEIVFDSKSTAYSFIDCIRLAIRVFSGLIPRKIALEENLNQLKILINRIPSNIMRIRLWSELALKFFLFGDVFQGRSIVNQHIKPLIEELSSLDVLGRKKSIVFASPVLFCANSVITFELIESLEDVIAEDEAYHNICEYILRKCPHWEPYEEINGQGYKTITYEDLVEICFILHKMDKDYYIYSIITKIVDSIVTNKKKFSKNQISDIIRRIETVINTKFPNPRYIKHEGYQLASLAQVFRIRKTQTQEWIKLIRSAEDIPNIADRAYVFCIIGTCIPNTQTKRKQEIIEKTRQLIEDIPALYDKLEHYESFASLIVEYNPQLAKQYFKKAFEISGNKNVSPEIRRVQKRLIDLAHKIDPDLASSLASIVDDDEARNTQRILKERVKLLNLKKEMVNSREGDNLETKSIIELSEVAWMLLASLNANRIPAIYIDNIRGYIQKASKISLSYAYPILAWSIENTVRRYSNTNEAIEFLQPMFQATILGAELSAHMAERSLKILRQTQQVSISERSQIITSGDREKAISFLKHWFKSNVKDYIKICDPYFGPEDLEILKFICEEIPNIYVKILTSIYYHEKNKIQRPWRERYLTYWRLKVSEQEPPDTEIVVVGAGTNGASPIHDRWWVTRGSGLRLGTSYNSLGLTKDSDISVLTKEEAELREKTVDQYLNRMERYNNGEKLRYELFTL